MNETNQPFPTTFFYFH